MSKLRLHVWVLPLQGPAAANKLPPFLLLAPPGATLKELSELIFNQHQRNYPNRPPLNIKKLQDSDECDIDLSYLVADVFRDKDVVKVIQAPPERESSLAPQSALRPHLAGFPSKRRQDELGWWGPSSGSVRDQYADSKHDNVELRPHKRQRMQEIDRSPSPGQFDPDRPLPSREDSPEMGDNGGERHDRDEQNGEPTSSVTIIHDSQRSQNMGPPQSGTATKRRKCRHDNGHDIYTIPDSPKVRPSDPQHAPQKQGLQDDDDESTKSESSDEQVNLHNIPRSTMTSPFKDVHRPATTPAKAKPASFVRPPLPPLSVQRSADGHADGRQRTVSTAPTTPLSPRQLLAMSQTASAKGRRPGPAVMKPQPRATTVQSELSSISGHPVYDTVEMDLDSSPEAQRLPHRPSPGKVRKGDQSSSEVQVPSSSQMLFRNLPSKQDPVATGKEANEKAKAPKSTGKKRPATKNKTASDKKSNEAGDHDRLPEEPTGPLPIAGKGPIDHEREEMQDKADTKVGDIPILTGSDTHIQKPDLDETARRSAAVGKSGPEEMGGEVGDGPRARTTKSTTPKVVKNDIERSRLEQEVKRKSWEQKTKKMAANDEGQGEVKTAREEHKEMRVESKGPEKKRDFPRGPLASILHKRLSDGQLASSQERSHSPKPTLRSSAAPSDSSDRSRQGKRLSSTPLYPRASSVRTRDTNTAIKTTPPVRDVGIEAQMPLPASLRRSVSFADDLPTSGQKPTSSPSVRTKANGPFSPAVNTNILTNRASVPSGTRRSGTPTTYGKPYPGSPPKATNPASVASKVTPVFPPGKGPVDLVKHTQVWPPGKGPDDLKKVAEARQQTPAKDSKAKKSPDQVKIKQEPPAAKVQTILKATRVAPTKKADKDAVASQEIVISSDEEKSASSYYSSESADETDESASKAKTKAEVASTEKSRDATSPTSTVSQPGPKDGPPKASIQEKTRSPSPTTGPAPDTKKDNSRSASRSPARYLPDTPNDSHSEPTESEAEDDSDAEAESSSSRSPSKSPLPEEDAASTTSKDVSMADAPALSTTSPPPRSASPTDSEASSASSSSSASDNPSQQIDLDLASQLQQTADQSESQSQSQSHFPPSKAPVSSSQILPTHPLDPFQSQSQPQRPKAASRFPSLTALVSSHSSPYEKSAVVAAGRHQPREGSPLRGQQAQKGNGTKGRMNGEGKYAAQSDSDGGSSDSSSDDDDDDDDDDGEEEEESGDPGMAAKKGGKSKMAGRLSGLFNSMWPLFSSQSTQSSPRKRA